MSVSTAGLAFLTGGAAAVYAERQGLVPKEMPSLSDIPTDWTALIAKARETVLGGATVADVVSDVSKTVSSSEVASSASGKLLLDASSSLSSSSTKMSALQVAALLSGAATGAIIAYYGTEKSLEKAKEFAVAFKKKVHLFDLWLKEVVVDFAWPGLVKVFSVLKTQCGKVFVCAKTFTKKTFAVTKMGELKRIVSADKIYKAKDSVVVMITPTLIVVKNVAMNGVERATLFSKASYMKAMAFADTLVNKMNKKNEEREKKAKTNKKAPPAPKTTTAPAAPKPTAPTA
jgi:hypothetical protein